MVKTDMPWPLALGGTRKVDEGDRAVVITAYVVMMEHVAGVTTDTTVDGIHNNTATTIIGASAATATAILPAANAAAAETTVSAAAATVASTGTKAASWSRGTRLEMHGTRTSVFLASLGAPSQRLFI